MQGSLGGPWRVPEGPWGPWGAFGEGSLRNPSKVRENVFFIYWNIFSYYSVGQIIQLLLRVGSIWGPCGLPPLRDCLVALFDTNFDKKTYTFLMAFFPEIGNLVFVHSRFHLMFFIFPLVAFMSPQISSYFLQFYLSSFFFLFKIPKLCIFWKLATNIFW